MTKKPTQGPWYVEVDIDTENELFPELTISETGPEDKGTGYKVPKLYFDKLRQAQKEIEEAQLAIMLYVRNRDPQNHEIQEWVQTRTSA